MDSSTNEKFFFWKLFYDKNKDFENLEKPCDIFVSEYSVLCRVDQNLEFRTNKYDRVERS